jgi:capsular polysaccharide transport system permease protein
LLTQVGYLTRLFRRDRMTQQIAINFSKLQPIRRQQRFLTLRTIMALVLREMTSTYGRSPGGYLWAVIEPAAGIALMAFIFTLFLRNPPLGSNFLLFYATGLLPFMMFLSISTKMSQTLAYSRQLLSYPRVTIIDALAARLILNVITQLMVSIIVLGGILGFFDLEATFHLPAILLSYAMAIGLGAGIGTMNCFLSASIPVWSNIWAVITRPLLIVSCVLHLFDSTPMPWRGYLWFNPLIHVVGEMRSAFYMGYDAPYVSVAYVFGVALVIGLLGLLFLSRYYRNLKRG